jgi:predicted acetyltransferase
MNDWNPKDRARQRQFGYLDFFMEGMTEAEFIDRYDDVRNFYSKEIDFSIIGFARVPVEKQISTEIYEILNDIYVSNKQKNSWASRENWSEELRLFLKLKGENI